MHLQFPFQAYFLLLIIKATWKKNSRHNIISKAMAKDSIESCATHNRRAKVRNSRWNCESFTLELQLGMKFSLNIKRTEKTCKTTTFIWSYTVGEFRWKTPLGDFSRKGPHIIACLFLGHLSQNLSPRKWHVLFQLFWGQRGSCSGLSIRVLSCSIQIKVMSPSY